MEDMDSFLNGNGLDSFVQIDLPRTVIRLVEHLMIRDSKTSHVGRIEGHSTASLQLTLAQLYTVALFRARTLALCLRAETWRQYEAVWDLQEYLVTKVGRRPGYARQMQSSNVLD